MGITIKNIEYYLPEKTLSNHELELLYTEWTAEKILKKTGISSRHIAGDDEVVSDLAYKAADKLLSMEDRGCVDFLLLATQSPDYLLPTTACILQDRLGLSTKCGALDFNLGCSAYIYGLALAKSLIVSGVANNVLLIMAEIYTRHIHKMDKSTRTLFGDGAAASLICESGSRSGGSGGGSGGSGGGSGGSGGGGGDGDAGGDIGEFVLGTDGSGASSLIIPTGGLKAPRTEESKLEKTDEDGNTRSADNLYMDGAGIFNFTIDRVPVLVEETLRKNNTSIDDIDLFVFHQANAYMLKFLRQKINIPSEKFYINLEYTGNTVSSTIPIALKMAEADGALSRGNLVMLVGFGVGLSWGAVVIKY